MLPYAETLMPTAVARTILTSSRFRLWYRASNGNPPTSQARFAIIRTLFLQREREPTVERPPTLGFPETPAGGPEGSERFFHIV